ERDELVNVRRPEIVRAVAAARDEGDLRENAGYHAAKFDQGMIEARIRELESMLRRVEIIDREAAQSSTTAVRLGSTVTIDVEGDQETYTIVGAVEANPAEGRISNLSPFGKALMGARVGQTVNISTPSAVLQARVLGIE
ncbi:MAG TPA: transcription elongation factor GreA, partial [Thermomicrobiales bacterium]|nr:transcription elongation factor GreA [Thermomicrobiales bacterium]